MERMSSHLRVWRERSLNGETALSTGQRLTVVDDFEKPSVGDRQAEAAVLAGPVCQRTTVGSDVPLLWLLAVCDGSGNALLPVISCLPHPLVGLPGFLCTLLVDVIGRVGFAGGCAAATR